MKKALLVILGIVVLAFLGLGGYLFVAPGLNKENRQIDQWIAANNLNQYGDPQNTAYSNKKPCSTTIACYDFVKKMHPDKPWIK